MIFTIKGNHYHEKCFPGLNDLLHAAEKNPKDYNAMKRKFQTIAVNAIRRDLRGKKCEGKVSLHYTFCEPARGNKRDYDNICSAGRKIITDALVKTKTIVDDSPKYLEYGSNKFVYSEGQPFIRVEIEMVGTPASFS